MKKKSKKLWISFLLLFVVACSALKLNMMSDSQEVALGLQLDQEIKKNPKEYPIYKGNPAVKEYIDKKIFREVLKSPSIEKNVVYPYQLEIIQNDTTLNAFATPGGYVYVYTGLLKYLDSEAALAGVLGHEIGHAERHHAAIRMTNANLLNIGQSLLLGENAPQIATIAANLLSGLALLANSRADEDESDLYSFKYLSTTRFYQGGVKFFFEKMRDDGKVSRGGQGVATFLSTHPDPIARISSTEQRLKDAGIALKTYKDNDKNFFKADYKKNILDKMR
jgi:beta-barrel assembly-enhancing protease